MVHQHVHVTDGAQVAGAFATVAGLGTGTTNQ